MSVKIDVEIKEIKFSNQFYLLSFNSAAEDEYCCRFISLRTRDLNYFVIKRRVKAENEEWNSGKGVIPFTFSPFPASFSHTLHEATVVSAKLRFDTKQYKQSMTFF